MDNALQMTVSYRVPVATAEWVAREAKRLQVTKSEVIRRALDKAQESTDEAQGPEATRPSGSPDAIS